MPCLWYSVFLFFVSGDWNIYGFNFRVNAGKYVIHGLKAIASRLEAITSRLEAIATRLEDIAIRLDGVCGYTDCLSCFCGVEGNQHIR